MICDDMEGFSKKLIGGDNGGGEVHSYTCTTTPTSTTVPPPKYSISSNPSFASNQTSQPKSDIGPAPVLTAPGPSLPDDDTHDLGNMTGGGRRKKKKHKSGDDLSNTSAKSNIMSEEELVDAAIPILSENQGVEELTLPSTLPPAGETHLGGHYLLNNTLLDHILTEKKMQILQSPEVIEYLKKQMSKK